MFKDSEGFRKDFETIKKKHILKGVWRNLKNVQGFRMDFERILKRILKWFQKEFEGFWIWFQDFEHVKGFRRNVKGF